MNVKLQGYKNMRGDADLENQEELVEFFLKMVDRRKEKKKLILSTLQQHSYSQAVAAAR